MARKIALNTGPNETRTFDHPGESIREAIDRNLRREGLPRDVLPMLQAGYSLTAACEALRLDRKHVLDLVAKNAEFGAEYRAALADRADAWVDTLIDASRTSTDGPALLRWLLTKLHPDRFGDKNPSRGDEEEASTFDPGTFLNKWNGVKP